MSRKMIDCRDYPSDKKCSILISGEEEEVVKAAVDHAVSVHGMQNTAEVQEQIRKSLKDEPAEWFANKPKMDEKPRASFAS